MLLQPMLARLAQAIGLEATVHAGLRDLISLHGAEMGNVQLLASDGSLVLVAAQGLGPAFLETFHRVHADCGSVCARALRTGQAQVVPDVKLDEQFAPYRELAAAVPFRSVITFPLLRRSGELVGAISAHSANTFAPTALEFDAALHYCRHLAEAIAAAVASAADRSAAAERLSRSLLATA